MFVILKSILIVILVSSIITATCFQFFSLNVYGIFTLTTLIQIALGWFLKTYIDFHERKLTSIQQSQILSQIEQEATQAPCAHCGEINLIPIIPDGDNDFECIHCRKPNSVYVNVTVAQPTVPIDSQPYEVSNLNTSLESVKQQILKPDTNE
jgi:hypothetical protein